jgi:poly(3-hydroxybutyrate) depolymerase
MSSGGTGAGGAPPSGGSGGASAMGPGTPSEGCGKTDVPPSGNQTIDVGGTQREFIATVPDGYDPDSPHRLIFAWHGLGGTSAMIASNYYGLATRTEGSAIFIAAQGLPGTGQQSGLAAWSNTDDGDIAFTRAMLDWAKASYCVDVARVFSIGMSNGGLMSNIVGCELGDSFRAIVAMSGGGPEGYAMKPCTGQLAVWISHGNMDDNVPFSYGEASRDYWTNANHCGTATMPVMPGTCVEYQDCDEGFPVEFCEFDGGHMVPSFAGEAAWNFFAQF